MSQEQAVRLRAIIQGNPNWLRRLLLMALLLVLAGGLEAQAVAAHAALALDGIGTQFCLQTIPTCRERNPILGLHPSPGKLAAYNAVWHVAMIYAPKRVRPWLQRAVLVVSVVAIVRNPYWGLRKVGRE